ncbi:D-alanyl-D-alanine carboxypeptidase/D-alanyl-D-alanine-endopeptidase [Streptomyces sp. NPDC052051]|uniref:D-alanyl-D-alanine carboxypeptidase/D-alanyl-D-alanine endopeptidase n=1 Tax=Streptomyces sp. NPDC052051 TaxID=3154649 RepID=UPI003439D9C3
MVLVERRVWRAARPRLARVEQAVVPRLARAARAVRPRSGRFTTPQLTGVAALLGLALAAGLVTTAGPWDSAGQRTAERDRATAWDREGGADHGGNSGTTGDAPAPAPSAASVLAALSVATGDTGPKTPAGLTHVLDPLLRDASLGPRRSAVVLDVASGRRLYAKGADDALIPASTTKIATAVAVLSAAGPDHRFATRAMLEPAGDRLVLVGGGDPTLTAREKADGASLRTLAEKTATALKQRHVTSVALSYDTSLFAGKALHPIGVNPNLAEVTALMADEGRADDATSGPADRVPDPAADAARTFGDLLERHGIKVSAPHAAKATPHARTVAFVQSPPLSAVVERMLTTSDNDIAEALARQTALATGGRPSFDGGGAAIAAQLKKLGLPLKGAHFGDGSGLNRDDRTTAGLLTALLATAGSPAHPELRTVLTGLPVAGFTGTLSDRYEDDAQRFGIGVVRAKTGSLTGVNALAGTVVDTEGRLMAFAFLTDGSMDQTTARAALDRMAAALAHCGCR